jgi:hypothetical protein
MFAVQSIKIQRHRKVVKHPRSKRHAKQNLILIDVSKQLEGIRVSSFPLRRRGPEDRARLQDELVRAEVVALQKDELILVRKIERPLRILHHAKVQRLDARRARVRA